MCEAGFEVPSEAAWRDSALAASKKTSLDALTDTLPGGNRIEPLYTKRHASAVLERGEPGSAPFVRGSGHVPSGWIVTQRYCIGDLDRAAPWIAADVAAGVEGVLLVVDRELSDAECARLAEASLGASAIFCDAGEHAPIVGQLLGRHAPGRVSALFDPLGTLGLRGRLALGRDGALDAAAALARPGSVDEQATRIPARALAVGANRVHEAGGHAALELGFALAGTAELVRGLSLRGVSRAEAARQIALVIAPDDNVLVGAAKLRALRLCWSKLLVALGVEAPLAPLLIGVTSLRSMSRVDVPTNMVRGTNETVALILGCADVIVTRPFDDVSAGPGPLGRRLAKNTQLVLRDESHLGAVADPAGGSHFVEHLTDSLARAAWDELRAIEREGGLFASLEGGAFAARVREARAALEAAVQTRRRTLVGVNDFAEPDEPIAIGAAERRGDSGEHAALVPMREAAPFEGLRERAQALGRTGKRPRAVLVCLGTPSDHRAREEYCRRFFEAGGFEVHREEGREGTSWIANAVRGAAAPIAVLCSSDARYAELGVEAVERARAGGATYVLLAGKPGGLADALEAAGLDVSVHVGCDAVRALDLALDAAAAWASGGAA